MEAQTHQKPKVFISYSHKDERWKNKLKNHLRVAAREGHFEIWDDHHLRVGDRWNDEIAKEIDESSLAVLLISSSFLDSDFILQEEVPRLLQAYQMRGMRLFPIVVSECSWRRVSWLTDFQVRLLKGKPIAVGERKRQEAELVEISEEIWDLVREVQKEQLSRGLEEFFEIFRRRLDPAFSRWDLGTVGVAQAGGAGRPIEAALDDMYIPLRLADGYDLSKTDRGSLISPQALTERRIPLVIRGPAGAGKTTWMRWTFRQLLRMKSVFPVMLVLRDLARDWQTPDCRGAARALDAFLERWIDQHVPERKISLTDILSSKTPPRPVLLVDGWDELGPLGEELRAKLLGFLQQYPRVLAVVTSRPYGEGRPSDAEGFEILDIQPLSETDITDLSVRFFTHCYGEEETVVQKEAERFGRALRRSAEAKALARTALLLTMMLLISRSRPLPDKRHLLYEACIENLLTALPNRREEEGALLLREQWRPPDSEERLRVTAALAASVQQAGYKRSGRSPIVRSWDELVPFLPSEWNSSRQIGFLAWLAGPAGLLTDRTDGTVAFAHLSFQEFLTAWRMNATSEGKDERISIFLERLDDSDWWETLRLWAALIERQSRERLDPVLAVLSETSGKGLSFVGAVLADGLGTEARFEQWLSGFITRLGMTWPAGVELCAGAWSASRQDSRKEKLISRLSEKARLQSWLGWLRCDMFAREASLSTKLPRTAEGTTGQSLLNHLNRGGIEEPTQVAAGRVLSGGPGIWPVDPVQIGLLQVWPSHRRLSGLRLQLAQTCGADRSNLPLLGATILARCARDEAARSSDRDRARYLARDLASEWDRRLGRDLARSWACELARELVHNKDCDWARDWARDWVLDWARDLARGWAFEWARDWVREWARDLARGGAHGEVPDLARNWACNWARDWLLSLKIDPEVPWGIDFAQGEAYSWGRVSAILLLSRDFHTARERERLLISEACRISLDPERNSRSFNGMLDALDGDVSTLDPLWPSLARHIARRSTPEDRALLIDLAQHPEKREPPLSWGLQFIVRGDVMLDDGSVVTLDELADELGLPHLPYLEDMPDELEVDWEDEE